MMDRQVLADFDVPKGHRVLSRAKGPTCTRGYAVTREGAARLLYQIGVDVVSAEVDLEIMWHCEDKELRSLEVNPALIAEYRAAGPFSKVSDINDYDGTSTEVENPIGSRSVKSLMHQRLHPFYVAD